MFCECLHGKPQVILPEGYKHENCSLWLLHGFLRRIHLE